AWQPPVLLTGLLDRQVVFFGGKGGVGKTTCSSAFALAASQQGQRVLLVSTDPAHSTSDIFERPIGPKERELSPRLSALEIDGVDSGAGPASPGGGGDRSRRGSNAGRSRRRRSGAGGSQPPS